MCCDDDTALDLSPAVIEMLARYRRMRAEQGVGWGEEAFPDMFRWARFSRLGPAFDEFAASGDWAGAVRAAVGDDVPAGIALVTIGGLGQLDVRTGPPRPVVAGTTVPIDVVLDSGVDRDLVVTVDGAEVPVPAGGAGLRTVDATGPIVVTCGPARCTVEAVVSAAAATLRLTSPRGARWSVTDATGGAWFADGVPAKWDADDRPFFHSDPGTVELRVPAGPLHVVAARGLEFERREVDVEPAAGGTVTVEYDPARRFDPAADGWYGADLHVHLNYSGDHVLEPADAVRMQRGEGLALMHLAAGNLGGALVYDQELLEATAGTDLHVDGGLVRTGLEFRNQLLGHVHGLGLTGVPELRYTGVEGTDHPWDWPPNSVACGQMRDLGAVTTYAHPVFAPGDDSDDLFRPFGMVEARELIADAAVGVVDAVELLSCFDDRGALVLYHHLLSCGLRLAAVAGTDAFLSFARGPAPASNPPGWARVYAQLGGVPLSTDAFADAVRAGRTLVTNGPWPTFDVDGHGPGAVLERAAGDRLRVRMSGGNMVLYGPDGVIASGAGEHEVTVDGGLWLAAAVHGDPEPHTIGQPVFAHTTPVYVDVGGRRVARAASARWCLRQLDALQELAQEQGRFDPSERDRQFGDLRAVLDRARAFYRSVEEAAVSTVPPPDPDHVRTLLDRGDVAGLAALLAADPTAARRRMGPWPDHPLGADPLGYVAMQRYDTAHDVWRDVAGTADLARALLAAGAPVNGEPDVPESPLITAASYGDAAVARVLIDAGADLEATAAATAGGVPGGTALLHAAVFGMTAVVDVLVGAGARVPDLVLAAAAGDIRGLLRPDTDEQERILALIMAADHERLPVIDALVVAGTPVDGVDTTWGRHPLRTAAANGRPAAVARLLAHGADPALRDADGRTPLDLCRSGRSRYVDTRGHDEVEALLAGSGA